MIVVLFSVAHGSGSETRVCHKIASVSALRTARYEGVASGSRHSFAFH